MRKNIKFISYSGKYPNLCRGELILMVDNKEYKFGNQFSNPNNYEDFWASGGSCGFKNNYEDEYVYNNEWIISKSCLPDELKEYEEEIFNDNVKHGCCGGCL